MRFFRFIFMFFLTELKYCFCNPGDIARAKCEEYAQYVYSMEESPVLSRRSNKNKVSQCGMVEVPLVIGGVKASPKEFPHMAVLGYGSPPYEWKCGGTLISEQYVLSAAHCIQDESVRPVKVRLGEVDFDTPDESETQDRNIAELTPHPDYIADQKYNDLALLKLDKPVKFTAFVRPACLHTSKKIAPIAIATGFGKTSFDALEGSKTLMKVNLNVMTNKECEKYFQSEIESGTLSDGLTASVVCAGYLLGGRDTCQGDSGGPLQIALAHPYCMYSIGGVVSFGKFCGFANSPAIYTVVSEYIPWIERIVWK